MTDCCSWTGCCSESWKMTGGYSWSRCCSGGCSTGWRMMDGYRWSRCCSDGWYSMSWRGCCKFLTDTLLKKRDEWWSDGFRKCRPGVLSRWRGSPRCASPFWEIEAWPLQRLPVG